MLGNIYYECMTTQYYPLVEQRSVRGWVEARPCFGTR
jgi:hypothetical protein